MHAGRRRRADRRGVSEVIATLLLVAIAVFACVIALVFGTTVIHDLTVTGPYSPPTVSGALFVPGSNSQTAILTVSLRNGQSRQIQDISVTFTPAQFSNSDSMTMSYYSGTDGNPIPPTNLPIQSTAVGSAVVTAAPGTSFLAGAHYDIVLAVTYAGGSQESVSVDITAHS